MQQAFRSLKRNIRIHYALSKAFRSRRLIHQLQSPPVRAPSVAVRLREYQEECIQSVLHHLEKGHRRLGISLATGSGKTVIFTQLIDRVDAPENGASQTLILVHRRELVEQAARHCANAYPTKTIEIEMANLHASGKADITVASVRSITSGDRILKYDPRNFKLVLVDEAHHIVASSYMQTLRHFGLLQLMSASQNPALVGVSATFSRFDGLRLSDAIDHIVYHKDYVDMIGEKWLSNAIFTTVQSKADISRVKSGPNGDFQTKELSNAVNTVQSNEIIVRTWLSRAKARKSTIVFCVDLAHVASLTAVFRTHGVDARSVTSDTPKSLRGERIDEFRGQKFPVLLNCGVLVEGTDIPNVDCILLARPTKSRNLLVQMIGRGMRLYPGKLDCHVIDMVSSLEVGIVTTPTLFGLDPAELVKESNVDQLNSLREQRQVEAERMKHAADTQLATLSKDQPQRPPISLTFTDYESVHDLIDDTSAERYIRGISPLAWVLVNENRYVLSSQNGDYMTIELPNQGSVKQQDLVKVLFTQKMPGEWSYAGKSPYLRPREVAKAETFTDAVHAADTFASNKFPLNFIQHSQPWRRAPVTDAQLNFLNKFRGTEDQLVATQVTKGKATDMITKMKFGAKGWFSKIEAAKRREDRNLRINSQLASLKEREQVKVGPLQS
ncbi:MAG: hypothetical protein LQ351_008044 [Letrouitia transgressa]|nr:MAG: hypothetical protein LQ351_008044 [Letrouitia transgressa]